MREVLDTSNYYVSKIVEEVNRASAKFKPFASKHEGFAILNEEVEELWEAIKDDKDWDDLESEAIQVGAMALRFLNDIVAKKKSRRYDGDV